MHHLCNIIKFFTFYSLNLNSGFQNINKLWYANADSYTCEWISRINSLMIILRTWIIIWFICTIYSIYVNQMWTNPHFPNYFNFSWFQVMGTTSWIHFMGSILVIFGDRSKKYPKQGSRKGQMLVIMDSQCFCSVLVVINVG